jgi:hypothetical protein
VSAAGGWVYQQESTAFAAAHLCLQARAFAVGGWAYQQESTAIAAAHLCLQARAFAAARPCLPEHLWCRPSCLQNPRGRAGPASAGFLAGAAQHKLQTQHFHTQ